MDVDGVLYNATVCVATLSMRQAHHSWGCLGTCIARLGEESKAGANSLSEFYVETTVARHCEMGCTSLDHIPGSIISRENATVPVRLLMPLKNPLLAEWRVATCSEAK